MKYDFMVSVRLMTYNHEAYINQAIEGILKQKINFKIEVVIGDDFSTDNTLEKIKAYKSTKNISIKILDRPVGGAYWIQREKLGRFYNFVNILDNCQGKYIALLDGDDYWTDPLKLQKQVDFLEKHKNVNLVHTDFDWYNQNNNVTIENYYGSINYKLPEIYDIKQFFFTPKIRSLTICIRNHCLEGFTKFLLEKDWTVADTALILYGIKNQKIGYIKDSTGVYRRGVETASTLKDPIKKFNYWQNASHKVKSYFYKYYQMNDKEVKKHLTNEYYDGMFNVAVPAKKYKYVIKSFFYKLFNLRVTKFNIKKLLNLILRK